MKRIILFLFLAVMIQGCNQANNKNAENAGANQKQILYTVKDSVVLLAEPTEKAEKLVNQKATKLLKKVYYLSVDETCELVVLEQKDGWSKVQVVAPEWLNKTHIGWVKTALLQTKHLDDEPLREYKENEEYEILFSKKVGEVNNHYVLVKGKELPKDSLRKVARFIKQKYSPDAASNIYLYDSKEIAPLVEKYPLEGKDYVDVADHFVYLLGPKNVGMYYPFKDAKYKEYGGANPIR